MIKYAKNESGPVLAYSGESGVSVLEIDGLKFKDHSRDGRLDKYEDWRLPAKERAADLASKLSIEDIAGLMLYSAHQCVPELGSFFGTATYDGKHFTESGCEKWALSDQQKQFLLIDRVRHVLTVTYDDIETAARWNNELQAFCEKAPFAIPANTSSDPRHGSDSTAEFNMGAGMGVSLWPEFLGIAATFDPEFARSYGEVVSSELRAMGITTALFPQIDIATEPRWGRFSGTFGESSKLSADMAKACCEGLQTSAGDSETGGGWGYDSVNAMVKHWPGGGSGEGGRDAHFAFGKYAVYPGNNFQEHLIPFTEGAFKLDGGTGQASAVMPYYTISYGQDAKNGENVGNSYSKYIITDLLRDKYGYDGVVCTDWVITPDESEAPEIFAGGRCWGVEQLSVAERHYKIIMAGVDQFGGNNEAQPILEAYKLGVAEHGETFMRKRFEESAVRLLTNIFRLGLFENPYLDVERSARLVANEQYLKKGYEAQVKSQILLKNKNGLLPIAPGATVYMPMRVTRGGSDWFGNPLEPKSYYPADPETVNKYYKFTENPDDADFGIVFINSPELTIGKSGYSPEDREAGGNGYVPISLQYSPYTAEAAREVSMAGGDPNEASANRSYKGKTSVANNAYELDIVRRTRELMDDKPVVLVVLLDSPMVPSEIEPLCDAMLANSGTSIEAILDIVSGRAEPGGLLPFQMPADMRTVELQKEDAAFDMVCYTDCEGHVWDFAYGMNWSGVISDWRTEKYVK